MMERKRKNKTGRGTKILLLRRFLPREIEERNAYGGTANTSKDDVSPWFQLRFLLPSIFSKTLSFVLTETSTDLRSMKA